jgi:hypothetical protein
MTAKTFPQVRRASVGKVDFSRERECNIEQNAAVSGWFWERAASWGILPKVVK